MGMQKLVPPVTLNQPIIKEVEPSFGEMMNEDSPKQDMPMFRVSQMVLDKEEQLEQRLTRSREDKDSSEKRLIFKQRCAMQQRLLRILVF